MRTIIDFDPNADDVMPFCEDPTLFAEAIGAIDTVGLSGLEDEADAWDALPVDSRDCAASVWLGSPYQDKDEVLRYGYGFYWSFFTMLGERSSPYTQLQTLFTVVTTFLGLFVYVSLFGQLVALLEDSAGSTTANRQKMDLVSQCMRRYSMPAKLQSRIRSYYELHFTRQTRMVGSPAVLMLFHELPQYMRQEVALFLNKDMIERVPIFQGCSITFITAILMKLKPSVCLPNDYIIRQGEVGREMYFISAGQVQVLDDKSRVIAVLRDGSFFGEVALHFNDKRNASVKAISLCDLLVLTKQDFEDVLEEFPEEFETINEVARDRYTEVQAKVQQLRTLRRISIDERRRSVAVASGYEAADSEEADWNARRPSTLPLGVESRRPSIMSPGPPGAGRRMSAFQGAPNAPERRSSVVVSADTRQELEQFAAKQRQAERRMSLASYGDVGVLPGSAGAGNRS